MRYMSEFRDSRAASAVSHQIHQICPPRKIRIMEVCGGHTMTIYKYGIKNLLPNAIDLVSGPGCPVCVTSTGFIDHAVAISCLPGVVIASFGDLIRVPGSESSLFAQRSKGKDVRICYSPMEAVDMAMAEPDKQLVFLGIGFETTAPTVAAALKRARTERVKNFKILSAHKTMPHALRALAAKKEIRMDGLICPGHVSAITGMRIYEFLADQYHIPCVVCGFEPLDMLQAIWMILDQIRTGRAEVKNQYTRVVTQEGNRAAQQLLHEVFEPCDMEWRGLGWIPQSGLTPNIDYAEFDAAKTLPVRPAAMSHENPSCICGEIMVGVKTPRECPLFGKSCTPESPKGACMVSSEGNCAIYYKFFNLHQENYGG